MGIRVEAIGADVQPFNVTRLVRDLVAVLDQAARVFAVDYNATVATWSNPPDAEIERSGQGERLIGIDEERFGFVNEGTPPHIIRPQQPGGRLSFRAGYRAKTSPGVIRSRQGGSSGGQVFARQVMHPGTVARRFENPITLKNDAVLTTFVDAVLAKV